MYFRAMSKTLLQRSWRTRIHRSSKAMSKDSVSSEEKYERGPLLLAKLYSSLIFAVLFADKETLRIRGLTFEF
jgi:hypothetical protein